MSGKLRAATGTLAGAAVLITVVTLASRAVGFGRWLAQSHFLGQGGVDSPFNTANLLPNVLFEIAAGGALAGSVIPLLAGPIARRAKAETSQVASAFLGWTLAILVPLAALVALLAGPIAGVLRLDPEFVDIAAAFLRVFAIQIPLYGIAVVLGAVLQAHKRFFWPAFAPLVSSLVVIAVYVVFGRLADGNQEHVGKLSEAALNWLAWGMTAGVLALALPLVWPVHRSGIRLRPTLRFPAGEGRRAARLAFAGIAALVAQQVSVVVMLLAANGFGTSATWTVFVYTQQVYLLPYAVLAFPIATSAFPRFAEHVAEGRTQEFHRLVASTTRALLVVVGVGVAALVAAARPSQAVFVGRHDPTGMSGALTAMAAGLVGYALILHLSRVLYLVGRQRVAVLATATGWLVVAAGAVLLPLVTGAQSQSDVLMLLGLATTLGMTVAGAGLLAAVGRNLGAEAVRGVGRTLLVLVVGTAVGGALGAWLSARLLPPGASLVAALAVGLLAALVSALVVVGVSLLGDRGTLVGLVDRRRTAAR